jgi:hypothetical protein
MMIRAAQIGLAGIFMISAVAMGGQSDSTSGAEQNSSAAKITRKEVLFEDSFTRDDLGDQYEILKPDSNRLLVSDGKLMIVATDPVNNQVMLGQAPTGDFVATVVVTMRLTEDNHVGMVYRVDEKNHLLVGVAGSPPYYHMPWYSGGTDARSISRRQPFFTKVIEGQENPIAQGMSQLGDRELKGYAERPETWYLQLQRSGSKYIGRISTDGVRWTTLGTHVIVQKHGRLGFRAGSGGGIENPAEFDDFVVQR